MFLQNEAVNNLPRKRYNHKSVIYPRDTPSNIL